MLGASLGSWLRNCRLPGSDTLNLTALPPRSRTRNIAPPVHSISDRTPLNTSVPSNLTDGPLPEGGCPLDSPVLTGRSAPRSCLVSPVRCDRRGALAGSLSIGPWDDCDSLAPAFEYLSI